MACVEDRKGETSMADHEMLEEHRQTWRGFVKLIAYSAAAAALTLILMAIFIL
jgi:hypothetical protein